MPRASKSSTIAETVGLVSVDDRAVDLAHSAAVDLPLDVMLHGCSPGGVVELVPEQCDPRHGLGLRSSPKFAAAAKLSAHGNRFHAALVADWRWGQAEILGNSRPTRA